MNTREHPLVIKAENFFINCDECDKEYALKELVSAYNKAQEDIWAHKLIKDIELSRERQEGNLTSVQISILHMAQRSLGLPETD